MSLYEEFIAKSRYSRYLKNEKRRENWRETVSRYIDFISSSLKKNHDYTVTDELKEILFDHIYNKKVMPSMRAVMTAGSAAERQNVACYNCSYLPIEDVKCFDELMYILLCGTGVGFSVEQKYVSQLPEVPDELYQSGTTIVVPDSKEGWAKSLRQLISLLYAGEVPHIDTSKVRPAGARLKTFGGRASGPEPLLELFDFVVKLFREAVGRQLTSIECHDICCKIAEIVVVGGVRRSALISLSDLSDDKMSHAKTGAWYNADPQRGLANNSATYHEKPSVGEFMTEWQSLYESKSGERGIFNRQASIVQANKNGRRDIEHEFGTNPCSEIILRPYGFCNLSEVVVREDDTLKTLKEKVEVATILGTFQSTLTHFPYLRKIWKKNAEEERLLGVSLTGVFDNELTSANGIKLKKLLETLKEHAVQTNKTFAEDIGINPSVAITCNKPSGTVSQLVNSASGLHTRHSRYYIRTVRNDIKDPLTQYMIEAGVPHEPCVMRPESTMIFSFPVKAPKACKCRDEITAIEHLELWLTYQRHWCEHKPSVTISVKEDEWMEVGAWVYKNFDEVTGVSFLPYSEHTYKQAPYQECSEKEYKELLKQMPKSIGWDDLVEVDDNVEGIQELACTSGACDII